MPHRFFAQAKPSGDDNDRSKADMIASEYEDFAYIVSHDLNAPLRHVEEFTRLLIGTRRSNLSEEEQEYVRHLENSLDKLEDMQKALLTFSRLNTRMEEYKLTDLNGVVAAVIEGLSDEIQKHYPTLALNKMPSVMVDQKQVYLLFFSILDNALKFHTLREPKRKVSLQAFDEGDLWLFEVRDNGIGIAEEHQETVFKLFRRLYPADYAGIGAGLTIAQKIVQRHNGEILIESEPGNGTSVFFTLPK